MAFTAFGLTIGIQTASLVALAFVAGMCVPFEYGIERLRGFGRAALSKLPYKPPTDETQQETNEV